MKKGEHYRILKEAGFPVPIHGVFTSSTLKNEAQKKELRHCVDSILTEGSGLAGVRTEPVENTSPLGNYPHYMPLRSFDEVVNAINRNEDEHHNQRWWYLVNEAFLDYDWNAVVKLTQEGALPGYWLLDGEVNLTDNLPLRPALNDLAHVIRANEWKSKDAADIRKRILRSGLLDTWMEVSKVRLKNRSRLIFWGLRGSSLRAKQ